MNAPETFTLSILITNDPAAHERLTGVLRRRSSVRVEIGTMDAGDGLARVTLRLNATPEEVEMLRRQIEKIVDVVEATQIGDENGHAAQMAMVRLPSADSASKAAVAFGGRLISVDPQGALCLFSDRPDRLAHVLVDLSRMGATTTMLSPVFATPG